MVVSVYRMKIPKQEDYAILLMSELTRVYPMGRVSLMEISKKHGISQLFLKKIALRLKKAGLIQSKEGLHGGYMLAKVPTRISVWDVIQAASPQKTYENQNIQEVCPLYTQCLPQTINKTIAHALEKSLGEITLLNLVGI